ncbi:hypothetical protein CDD83_5992 [Cordyceps sp. RAO-2017]|nr:hypothetical protein CDD83_5992 [Cordyceps sp. RAO-2017]
MQTLLRSSLLLAAALSPVAKGEKLLMSKSLNTCQEESGFSASLFDVIYTPENNSARINLDALSTIQGKVVIDLAVSVYGYPVFSTVIDPCKAQKEVKLEGLCPMVPGPIKSPFALTVPADTAKQIPGIAYTIPDLDAKVRVLVNLTSTAESIACVEASISNGKTVDLPGVKAATVAIAGLAQIASVVLGALGHSNAAAHVASNSLSLFGYFQAVAIVGLTGVRLPPIVEAWTMNFQWSMGIIRGVHTQDFLTWYQRSTGGTPAKILSSLSNLSVQVAKRSLETASDVVRSPMVPRTPVPAPAAVTSISSTAGLFRRGNIMTGSGSYVVYGLQRVAFKSKIETTNLFMTGLIFFCSLMAAAAFIVMVSKGICELCAKKKWCGKFSSFRHDWLTILKGSLAKVALVLFPQITIL